MSLDDALDALDGAGQAKLPRRGGRAEIEVERAGPIGARVRRVRVERDEPWDVREQAERLGTGLRALPERVEPQEISPELGGAILRTAPDELRGDGYFEVEVDARGAELRRVRLDGGERSDDGFALTREQLGRLIDQLDGAGD